MVAGTRLLLLVGIVGASLVMQASPGAQATPTEAALLERLSSQPADVATYLDLAKLYTAARRFDEAEQMLTQALALVRQARTAPNASPAPAFIAPRDRQTSPDTPVLPEGTPNAPLRVGGAIREPKKIRDVKPVYPEAALASRIQGIVILEAVIDLQGNVRDVRVLRSVPMLDQAAIEAVQQWQYTQTFLNGVPVEVIMTVTVNFALTQP